MQRFNDSTIRASFDFQFVILDDRVAQKLVRRVVQRLLRGGLVRAGREVNLDILADVDAGDTFVTHLFEGVLDGFALRIKHGLLGGDDNFCFHSRGGKDAKKSAAGRAIFDFRATALKLPAACAIVLAMVDTKHPDEAPCSNIGAERKAPEPCTIVIFGASGDLTARKLIPALYHLFKDKLMPPVFRIVGFARREKTDESWRQELRTALDQFSRTKPVEDAVWQKFAQNLVYCRGDLAETAAYKKLEE